MHELGTRFLAGSFRGGLRRAFYDVDSFGHSCGCEAGEACEPSAGYWSETSTGLKQVS